MGDQPTIRRIEGRRLAYYKAAPPDSSFWDQHWHARVTPEAYSGALKGNLGSFESLLLRYLPRDGRIVEAGCGIGQHVVALRHRGYDCEGVEWGRRTVEAVRKVLPELPIRVGDVTDLDVPDGYYQACISLGVVEHRREGPEPFFQEARRFLAEKGKLLVSVPHFNGFKRWCVERQKTTPEALPDGFEFYQYAFTKAEISELLETEGFTVREAFPYAAPTTLVRESTLFRGATQIPRVGPYLKSLSELIHPLRRRFGHMLLLACERSGG